MVITQSKSKRSPTGARYHAHRKKRLYDTGSEPANTRIGNIKSKKVRTMGGKKKERVFLNDVANVLDSKTGKYTKAKIKSVIENPANRHFIRRNILTKGAIIETEKGKARITSRPGQEGSINAVLVA